MTFQDNKKYINEQAYLQAKKRVDSIIGFYWHLIIYLTVNTVVLLGISSSYGIESVWNFGSFSMLFFWGIGLALHALKVFGKPLLFSKKWEEQKIKSILEKEQKRNSNF